MKLKRKDLGLIGAVLLIAFLCWVVPYLYGAFSGEAAELHITVNGEIYGVYSLKEDRIIEIGATNICEIKDGKVKMTEADCPDHLCIRQKEISGTGETIVCLPNKVVLEIFSESDRKGTDANTF